MGDVYYTSNKSMYCYVIIITSVETSADKLDKHILF